MVAIPVAIDQPGVAARIAYTKTDAYVPLRELSTSRLSTLIDEVLGDSKYRQNANKMREAIVRTNELEKAADLLEQAFNLSLKPLTVIHKVNVSWVSSRNIRTVRRLVSGSRAADEAPPCDLPTTAIKSSSIRAGLIQDLRIH
jgi:hypothetical protein